MTTVMVQRNTLADSFVRVGDEKTEAGLHAARQMVGEDAWKAGYSKERRDQVRAALKEHGVEPMATLTGTLLDVSHAQTAHKGTTFDKLRVSLAQSNGDTLILTGDMRSEFSQRLLSKLDTATQGAQRLVTIGGFAEPVQRNDKTYVNHVATLKAEDGQEIKAAQGHFAKAAEHGQAAADAMAKAGIRQPKLLQDAKGTARTEYFSSLAEQIHARLQNERQVTPIEQAGQVTGRFIAATALERGNDRVQVEMQRAGVSVLVDVPRQALPETIEPGTPLKLRYDQKNGVSVEVGKEPQERGKDRGRGI